MEFHNKKYNTVADWYIGGLAKFLSPLYEVVPESISIKKSKFIKAEQELHSYINNLYQNMHNNAELYNIPLATFEGKDFNKKRLKVRKVINIILDFLYKLAQLATLEECSLVLAIENWHKIRDDKIKKLKSEKKFNNLVLILGFTVNVKQNIVVINHKNYPAMLIALSYYAKLCSQDKKYGFRYFYQLDFRRFNNYKLQMNDVINSLPLELKIMVTETDNLLMKLKYRKKIELYEDFGYRVAYSNKAGVVYYIHINSYKIDTYYHYLRWVLNSAQSDKCINTLIQEGKQNIVDYLKHNIVQCDPNCIPGYGAKSPEQCQARIHIPYYDLYVCKDKGCLVGIASYEFEYIQVVLEIINEIISKK
ncbi:hypothetical protein IMX26_17605 [Clostridium sp. 'deep sea']|uniref:hypothetical protein n=1 Tax=Clostridium sp. 'deep sea' TaxID=2779445 RepID=UPI0018969405|nr:hypothetical protein [Clostridium sp. 'deep sea']QOR35243.1 hypothetical protein IMX26_17605 [Clostridium sp. 'deep sea']